MNELTVHIPKRAFNAVYIPYLDNTDRYLIFYGGAGSGKSYFIAERYIYRILQAKNMNLLVTRAVANTNRDSTFALFIQVLNKWGISKHFRVNKSDLRISCLLNGNEIVFKGLDDTEKLKSITFQRGELTDIWIEEASETTHADFQQLDVRLRGGKTKKQIVLSFNPVDINHWLKKSLIDAKDCTVVHTTYKDNRFLDEDYKKLLESYKESDPYYYSVYCLGQWGVYGKTIFDSQKVHERIAQITGPIKTGYFLYDYDGLKITNIKWCNDPDGYIKIYKDVEENNPYVLAGDTAGDGSDYFTGHVIDNSTGEQVAVLKQQFDEDIYAKQMYCLGMYFNKALLGIETNFSSYPIKELERLGYPLFYVREREDTYSNQLVKAFGFKTTSVTRPVIIAELVQIVRDNIELINDRDTLEEMLTFVRNEKGRPEAQKGSHDDLIMALAIAYYIRPQQTYVAKKVVESKPFYNFDIEKPVKRLDYGDKIKVI